MSSKKDYEAVALILKEAKLKYKGCTAAQLHGYLAEDFATYFADDNVDFDRGKFYKACGVTEDSATWQSYEHRDDQDGPPELTQEQIGRILKMAYH